MNQMENKTSNKSTDKLQLKVEDAVIGFRKFSWLCVLLALVFGSVVFVREHVTYVPYYRAEATLTVNAEKKTSPIGGMSVYGSYYDTATTNQLEKTFPYLLGSTLLYDTVCEDLGVSSVSASLQSTVVQGSNMLTIYCTARDPQVAYDVLVSTVKNYPTIAKYALGNIEFELISEPTLPIEPSNTLDYIDAVIKAMVAGFAIGCMIIVIYVYSRNTIRTREDVKEKLGCETMGMIPHISFKRHGKEIDHSVLCTNEKVDKSFYESIRILRNVFKNSLKEGEKIVIGTSTSPSEGKTTVITNTALALVEKDKKILLVDGDIRHPSVAPLLGIDVENLDFQINTERYRIAYLEDFGIYFMMFNRNGIKHLKYMNSTYVKGIFDSIRDDFDYILVDTPPCGLVSDALFFAQAADAAYYVILQDSVRTSRIQDGFNNLLATDVKILGCVLNGVMASHTGHGYGYAYGGYGHYGMYGTYGRYGRSRYGRYGRYSRYGYGGYGHYGHYGRYGGYGHYGRDKHFGHYGHHSSHHGHKSKSEKKGHSKGD